MSDAVPSPCVRQCTLDDGQVCMGCYRSMDEIMAWAALDNQQRKAVLVEAESRRKARTIKGI